jgi:hypothetical protein
MIKNLAIVIPLFFAISANTFAQKKLDGKYQFRQKKIIDVYAHYEFSNDGTFSLESGGDLGPEAYGRGIYKLSKEELILNFSSEKDPIKSKISIETEKDSSKNESVEFFFKFYDLENEMEVPATIFNYFEDESKIKYFQSNINGICNLILPKGQEIHTYTISMIGYESFNVDLKNDSTKTIQIGLARNSKGYRQIVGKSTEFKIDKFTKDTIFFHLEVSLLE